VLATAFLFFISAAFSAALYKSFNFIYRFKIEEFSVLLYSLIKRQKTSANNLSSFVSLICKLSLYFLI
jgi:hypothetical protein